jgi:hypothetical protein
VRDDLIVEFPAHIIVNRDCDRDLWMRW